MFWYRDHQYHLYIPYPEMGIKRKKVKQKVYLKSSMNTKLSNNQLT